MSKMNNLREHAVDLLRTLPRLCLSNIKSIPGTMKKSQRGRGARTGNYQGGGKNARLSYLPVGSEANKKFPFYLAFPKEKYYEGFDHKRQYPPLPLSKLQMMIDTNRLDTTQPIDLAAILNTKIFDGYFSPTNKHYGFNLTEEGMEKFAAKVNIEVQWASEPAIAAIERNGGVITNAYYDIRSLHIIKDPEQFFTTGEAIPKRLTPPEDAILFYTGAATRGYLADPEEISLERLKLAQKYGYRLPDIEKDPAYEMLSARKDPRQIFYGLEPGWVINLKDKCILKPKEEKLVEYFRK